MRAESFFLNYRRLKMFLLPRNERNETNDGSDVLNGVALHVSEGLVRTVCRYPSTCIPCCVDCAVVDECNE